MQGISGLSSGVRPATTEQGWWLVAEAEPGPARVVAGPFESRTEAGWSAGVDEDAGRYAVRPVYGVLRADGGIKRRPSPQEWAWVDRLSAQLDRLPQEWDELLTEDDALTTLVVEVTAALAEAGLGLHDPAEEAGALGGASLTPAPELGGLVVTWRQHDRMSVDQVHGATADTAVQQAMNHAVAGILTARGFAVEAFGSGTASVVRLIG